MSTISDYERAAVERRINELRSRVFKYADKVPAQGSTPALQSAMREIIRLSNELLRESIESPLR